MKRFGQALRLLQINAVCIRHGLDEILLAAPPLRRLRFLFYLLPWNWVRGRPREGRSVRIRRALEDLGPIFVKFGQILSTRRDLLPEDIGDELAGLQDRVPPFPGSLARRMIERSLGRSVDELFASFDEEPLASASIAQVHAASLRDGREVAVKVVRPGIEAEVRRDVGVLYWLAELAERYLPLGRRLKPVDVVAEYESTILDELDLMREAASASQLRRNFENSDLLHVPRVYWHYTRSDVMVMERISGIPVSDVDRLVRHGIDLENLAVRGVEIFFAQLMRDNFFHADMHPGNIFVSPEDPGRPTYIAVDFGIMGSLTPQDQRYLAENLLAFFNRDYLRVAELHVQSGWVPAGTRVNEFEAAIRSVCEPIFARPLKEISFGRLLMRLFGVAHRFHMEVQPQLLLLQKTLLNVEGLGRQLYPELDLWQSAKPFLEQWMDRQLGLRAAWRELGRQAPRWGEVLPTLPVLAHEVLQQARRGEVQVEIASRDIESMRLEMRRANRRTVRAVVGSALVVSAVLCFGMGVPGPLVWGTPLLGWALGMLGAALVIAAWPGKE